MRRMEVISDEGHKEEGNNVVDDNDGEQEFLGADGHDIEAATYPAESADYEENKDLGFDDYDSEAGGNIASWSAGNSGSGDHNIHAIGVGHSENGSSGGVGGESVALNAVAEDKENLQGSRTSVSLKAGKTKTKKAKAVVKRKKTVVVRKGTGVVAGKSLLTKNSSIVKVNESKRLALAAAAYGVSATAPSVDPTSQPKDTSHGPNSKTLVSFAADKKVAAAPKKRTVKIRSTSTKTNKSSKPRYLKTTSAQRRRAESKMEDEKKDGEGTETAVNIVTLPIPTPKGANFGIYSEPGVGNVGEGGDGERDDPQRDEGDDDDAVDLGASFATHLDEASMTTTAANNLVEEALAAHRAANEKKLQGAAPSAAAKAASSRIFGATRRPNISSATTTAGLRYRDPNAEQQQLRATKVRGQASRSIKVS